MVDASHTPDEPGSEAVPGEGGSLSESASESAAEIIDGTDSEPVSIPADPIEPVIEAENLDSAPEAAADPEAMSMEGESSEPLPTKPLASADQAESPISDFEEGLILEERSEDEGPYASAEDFVDVSESADDSAASDAAESLPSASDADRTGPAEAEEDWDLGELETTADAADAAKLATQSKAAGISPMQRIQALLQPALKLWRRLLRGVRSRLPQVASLSDRVLSGILIGIFVLLLVLINRLGQPSVAAVVPSTAPPAVVPSATSPEPTSATELETPIPEAPANPDLERIADIQDQLAAVATSYASNLVVSVQASFAEDRLSANLSAGWYRLPRDQQDQLAADLLGRSQTLEFATLELIDPDGSMVARSPVVGKTMVIMQRQPPPEVPIPERPRYSITLDH
jgi:hypothetical protein